VSRVGFSMFIHVKPLLAIVSSFVVSCNVLPLDAHY
jgi:hypothetical protein